MRMQLRWLASVTMDNGRRMLSYPALNHLLARAYRVM
jgi:hypothetical protein